MKFPYGMSDFAKVIREGCVYIDRTDRIPLIENAGDQLLFLRPRRFGKSLWISLLENYYDVARAEQFDSLFGHLKIGQNPTPLHNQYFVLKWDFSSVPSLGSTEKLQHAIYDHLNECITTFRRNYQLWLPDVIQVNPENALASFQNLLGIVKQTPYRLYLLIDEYDNFANDVMMSQLHGNQRYGELVYGEGLLKSVFKNIKAASVGNGLDRVFITGVSPVVLADMSSGYNVVKDISRRPEFNDLCGFQEQEVIELVQAVIQACSLPTERIAEAMALMRTFYNGYCFNTRTTQRIYNPTLALYFLDNLIRDCAYPDNLLDHNLAMDRNRLSYISQLPHGTKVIEAALDESQPLTVPQLHDRFGIEDMLLKTQEPYMLASLLYYLGVLTMDGKIGAGKLKLRIPNLVVRRLYVERLRELVLPKVMYEEYSEAADQFFLQGNLRPLCDFIETRLNVFSNRDYRYSDELAIKTAFLMLLFDDRLYVVDSEPELDRRYADLSLIARPDARQYQILDHVIEFKFVKLSDVHLTGEQAKTLSLDELSALPAVQVKKQEATQQLRHYQQALNQRYGDVLKLQIHAVVAIGFERLVWWRVE